MTEPLLRLCGWLGEHLILDYIGTAAQAARFENSIRDSFSILDVTSEPATSADQGSGSSRPSAGR